MTRSSERRRGPSRRWRRCTAGVALWLSSAGWTPEALSQAAPKPQNTESAITLAREGKDAYDRGDWKTALDLFNAAEGRAHSPVMVLYIARCRRNLGQLVAARDSYGALAGESLAADAPEPFKAAKADAQKDLAVLEPRIPRVTIALKDVPSNAVVLLDQRVLSAVDLASPLSLDPGTYQLRATLAGEEIGRTEVKAVEGVRSDVTLQGQPVSPRATAAPPPPTPTTAPVGDPTLDVVGTIALVLGAGGLGVGIATRVMAFDIVGDVKARCVVGFCLAEDEAEIDRAIGLQTGSTIGLLIGGAAAATGVTLLIVSATRDGASEPTVSLHGNLGGLSLSGSF
jgi:hypothetical protein